MISNHAVGWFLFRASIFIKILSSIWSNSYKERAIEYPWLIKQLRLLKEGSLVLDVGCAESLLSAELVMKKFRVIGVDIRKYPWKNKLMDFVREDCRIDCFRNNIFDAIIMVSTIEHVALNETYAQKTFDSEGDMKVMKELFRILKPLGLLFLTTPFIGKNPYKVIKDSRHYDITRLKTLCNNFRSIKSDCYFRDKEKSFSNIPGVICLILQK